VGRARQHGSAPFPRWLGPHHWRRCSGRWSSAADGLVNAAVEVGLLPPLSLDAVLHESRLTKKCRISASCCTASLRDLHVHLSASEAEDSGCTARDTAAHHSYPGGLRAPLVRQGSLTAFPIGVERTQLLFNVFMGKHWTNYVGF
jgi:hypothetical protein